MEVLITKDNLLYGVQTVGRTVSSKTTMPILSGILLEAKDNILRFSATDLEMGIQCEIPVHCITPGSIVVPAKIFAEVARRLPDTQINLLKDNESHTLKITYDKSEFNLNIMDPQEFPLLPLLQKGDTLKIRQNHFKSIVKHVIFATSNDDNRPLFTGALLEIKDDQLRLVATDTHRLALYQTQLEDPIENEIRAIIPGRALNEVSRLLPDEDQYFSMQKSDTQMLFQGQDFTLLSRLIEGQFPNYNQVIPQGYKTRLRVKTKDLTEAVERAAVVSLSKESSHIIKLKTDDNTLIITSSAPELGRVREEIPIYLEGEPANIAFNYRYLLDVLRVINVDEFYLDLTGSLSPGIIKPIESTNYLYLILPVRTA